MNSSPDTQYVNHPEAKFSFDDILALLPHRPPFLFVDSIVKMSPWKQIVCERTLRPEEPWFEGHFPGQPIMPGVLVTDALAQTSGLLYGFSRQLDGGSPGKDPEIFYLAAANMKYTNPAVPGDTLRLTATFDRSFGTFYMYNVDASVGRNLIAKGALTLAMRGGNG